MSTLHKTGELGSKSRKSAGRRRDHERNKEARSVIRTSNDFLRQQFLPLRDAGLFKRISQHSIETNFYNSLTNVCNYYPCNIPNYSDHVFTYNIFRIYKDVCDQLKQFHPEVQLKITEVNGRHGILQTVSVFDTNRTLYYVPVEPLVNLLKTKANQQLAGLILSMFAYLHHVTKMSWHTGTGDYLSGTYEMIQEWLESAEDEYDTDDFKSQVAEFTALRRYSKIIYKSLNDKKHLHEFEKRVHRFTPVDQNQKAISKIAKTFLTLYKKYGMRNFFDNMNEALFDPEDDNHIRIYADQYFSFCWNNDGWIADQLFDTVNSEFQEMDSIQEPTIFRSFEQPHKLSKPDFAFESELLNAINDLSYHLNHIR